MPTKRFAPSGNEKAASKRQKVDSSAPLRRSPRKPWSAPLETSKASSIGPAGIREFLNKSKLNNGPSLKDGVTEPSTKRKREDKQEEDQTNKNGVVGFSAEDLKETNKEEEEDSKAPSKSSGKEGRSKPKKSSQAEGTMLQARTTGIPHYIGAHVSIAKGVQNAVHNAKFIGANAFAIFLKSQRKWDNPALQDESVKLWQDACKDHGYHAPKHVLPHGSYLVNLASQTPEQHQKSVDSFVDDLRRCDRLGIGLYNFHPGNTNGAPKSQACRKIAEAINLAHQKTEKVVPLLETMASNKANSNVVGGKFEDLAMVIADVEDKSRVGVCIDTCHSFAAGYDIVSKEGFRKTMEEFDRVVGRKYLRAWHLNDSKAPFGSGRDLHANIGTGFIGLQGFWNVMNMDVWGKGVGVYDLPMVLETPIDEEGGGMVPKKGEKKEEDKSIWAGEIKLLESLVGMDCEGEEFKKLAKELYDRGAGQREKTTASKSGKK